jgi:hypothetical protein
MPLEITELELDSIEALSLVDKGASGDEENRPSILLYKRDKSKMLEKVLDAVKAAFAVENTQTEEKQMPVEQKLAELGLSEEQMAAVLEILQQLAAPPAEPAPAPAPPAAPEAPVGKQEEEEEEEEKQMTKRDAEHKAELLKREQEKLELEKRVKFLEDQAEMIEIEKRADELKWLPQSREETVAVLKAAKGDEKILSLLAKTNEAMKQSPVLQVIGHSAEMESDPMVRINKRAKEITADNPQMSIEAARGQAMAEDPDLYREAKG